MTPLRTWEGLTPWQTEDVTRGAKGRACCPDCWRWHIDGFRNTPQGHCWSCHLEIQNPGSTSEAWVRYLEMTPSKKPKTAAETAKLGLKRLGS